MKSIPYILMSYFQQHFFGVIAIVIGLIAFLVANVLTFTQESAPPNDSLRHWFAFLCALIMILAGMASHLKRLIQSQACALYPHYRRNQAIAAGIILMFFVGWPVFITAITGFPAIITLAMFLTTTSLILWMLFRFDESVLIFCVVIWSLRLVYEMLGLDTEYRIFRSLADASIFGSQSVFAILVAVLAGIALYLFFRYFLTVPIQRIWSENSRNPDPYAAEFEKTDASTLRMINRKLADQLEKQKGPQISLNRMTNMLQFSLFSPRYIVPLQGLWGFLVLALHLLTVFFIFILKNDFWMVEESIVLSALIFLFYLSVTILTTDFLQHRNRMPAIWMQAQFCSREEFARATMLTVFKIGIKQYLIMALIILVATILISSFSFFSLLSLLAIGLLIYIIVICLSLLWSDEIRSTNCKGWTITNTLLAVMVLIITASNRFAFSNPRITWLVILGMTLLSLFLLRMAFRKWSETEMDFLGPDLSEY